MPVLAVVVLPAFDVEGGGSDCGFGGGGGVVDDGSGLMMAVLRLTIGLCIWALRITELSP
jgi:hypothetical protein